MWESSHSPEPAAPRGPRAAAGPARAAPLSALGPSFPWEPVLPAEPRDTGNKVHAMLWPGFARQKVTKGARLPRASGGEARAWPAICTLCKRCSVPTRTAQQEQNKGKAIWHSLSACPVSTCTYESCSSARCLCLLPRLVTLGFVTRAWRFRGCSACSVLATSTSWPSAGSARGAVTGKVSGILSCLASPSRSLWSNSCYFAFSTSNSHTSTEMLKQDGETQNSALPALPAQPPLHPPLAKPK